MGSDIITEASAVKSAKISRFVMRYTESNMYVCIEENKALLVDPHPSEDALELLRNHEVGNVTILLTHEHFDHTSGVNWFRERYPIKLICQQRSAESIGVAKNNRPFVFFPMVEDKSEKERKEILAFYDALPSDAIQADVTFEEACGFFWRGHRLYLRSCPGHSMGSTLIYFDDVYVFSGDYMIPGTPVILRFPGGSKKLYQNNTLPYLLALDEGCVILPGHGKPYRFDAHDNLV